MNDVLKPASLAELVESVRSAQRVLALGGGTKPRLSAHADSVPLSTAGLTGIVEYEPDEFTFTARAGTPLRDLIAVLAERGQYLPWDPPLVEAGATLGGTVAAGLSGPGRFRFGGVRDFILGVRFVDGMGRLLRLGGKVVKNAAGFDLPKFFCGSLGRFGVLGEITFKVFPRPSSTVTLRLRAGSPEERLQIFSRLGRSRWEPDALEGDPESCDTWVRLAGPVEALVELEREILTQFPGESVGEAEAVWRGLREFHWAHPGGVLVKVPVTPADTVSLARNLSAISGLRHQIGAGGNLACVSLPSASEAVALNSVFSGQGLEGLTLRGDAPRWWSRKPRPVIESAVKRALDPGHRFPSLDT